MSSRRGSHEADSKNRKAKSKKTSKRKREESDDSFNEDTESPLLSHKRKSPLKRLKRLSKHENSHESDSDDSDDVLNFTAMASLTTKKRTGSSNLSKTLSLREMLAKKDGGAKEESATKKEAIEKPFAVHEIKSEKDGKKVAKEIPFVVDDDEEYIEFTISKKKEKETKRTKGNAEKDAEGTTVVDLLSSDEESLEPPRKKRKIEELNDRNAKKDEKCDKKVTKGKKESLFRSSAHSALYGKRQSAANRNDSQMTQTSPLVRKIRRHFQDESGDIESKGRLVDVVEGHKNDASAQNESGREEELWTTRHRPTQPNQLCVSAVKSKELQSALNECWANKCRLLVLAGPPGVGKSTALKLFAALNGRAIVEYAPPAKVSIFAALESNETVLAPFLYFLKNLRLPALTSIVSGTAGSATTGQSASATLGFVDEVPHAYSRQHRIQIQTALEEYVRSRYGPPLAIVLSASTAGGGYSDVHRLLPDSLLSSPLVKVVSFQPVTEASMKRCLTRILHAEATSCTANEINGVISTSGGDIRNAVTGLQFFLRGAKSLRSNHKEALEEGETNSAPAGRDLSLSLFHALGKVLYNKRLEEIHTTISSTPSQLSLLNTPRSEPSFLRAPMKSTPDEIHASVHAPASTFIDYLHENYLQFFMNVDEVSAATEYLSDAAVLCASATDAVSLPDRIQLDRSCWEVAVRGLLFSHVENVPSAWTPLTKPQSLQYEPEIAENELQYALVSRKSTSEVTLNLPLGIAAGDLVPYLSLLQQLNSPLLSRLPVSSVPWGFVRAMGEYKRFGFECSRQKLRETESAEDESEIEMRCIEQNNGGGITSERDTSPLGLQETLLVESSELADRNKEALALDDIEDSDS